MKENSIKELQERLETLHVIQDARLACNADDLDIREEIAEIEEEIKELQDDTNVNRENSIEKNIKNVEHFINSIKTDKEYKEENGWHGYYNKEIVELARMLEHILSDYKRVLKENEKKDELIERMKRFLLKENKMRDYLDYQESEE